MAKTELIGVRLTPDVKTALEKAALNDDRPVASMAAKLITDRLREMGLLKRAKT